MNSLTGNELADLKIRLLALLENDEHIKALEQFLKCPNYEQIQLFEYLGAALKKTDNLAIKAPTIVTSRTRRLKENKNFDDFYAAWQPLVKATKRENGQYRYSYFNLSTRVINAQNLKDTSEIISIGFQYNKNESQFTDEIERCKHTEQLRHEKIKTVADSIDENKYYLVLSDDILGP